MNSIRIGSRGSDLALWQAHFVQAELAKNGIKADITIIKTQGDQIQHLSFDKLEGKGFFTKEIEEALLNNSIDLAVHSHKDLPTTSPEGLVIAAVSLREDPSELLLIHPSAVNTTLAFSLKKGAVVGTSSARRKSQLLSFRPDIEIKELRGNVPTRINKLKEGQYDAILIAAAGVERLQLDLSPLYMVKLNPKEFIPAPAQGVLALQVRETDAELIKTLQALNHTQVQQEIAFERKILNLFDGGCQLPLGAYCYSDKGNLKLYVSKALTWKSFPVRLAQHIVPENTGSVEKTASAIIERINNLKPCKVFITRDLTTESYLVRSLQANHFTLTGESLISTEFVSFDPATSAQWLFFSSKNGVQYYFQQVKQLPPNVKTAAIGSSTAEALRQHNVTPDFVGDNLDTTETGKAFASKLGAQDVLFIEPEEASGNVSAAIPMAQKTHLKVYKTLPKEDFKGTDADILVFTSPSNAEVFLKHTSIKPYQKVIAIGLTTKAYLQSKNIQNIVLPLSSDEMGLAEAIYGCA